MTRELNVLSNGLDKFYHIIPFVNSTHQTTRIEGLTVKKTNVPQLSKMLIDLRTHTLKLQDGRWGGRDRTLHRSPVANLCVLWALSIRFKSNVTI